MKALRHGRHAALAMLLGVVLAATAQEAQFTEQGNQMRSSPQALTRMVLAAANVKVGVSLERLSLISGEGNTDKKIVSGLLAGVAALSGVKGDFAEREPIHEHLSKDDADKIGREAVEVVTGKLRDAGIDVVGPEAVVAAPFYAGVKGEAQATTDHAKQDGGVFKKSYYYGFYRLPVAGLKYREIGLFARGFGDDELFPKAREAAGNVPAALDISLALVNDKRSFFVFDFSARVWAPMPGRSGDIVVLNEVLKNKDDFSVPSGGKDTYAYWSAFKPRFEAIAEVLAQRVAAAAKTSAK